MPLLQGRLWQAQAWAAASVPLLVRVWALMWGRPSALGPASKVLATAPAWEPLTHAWSAQVSALHLVSLPRAATLS